MDKENHHLEVDAESVIPSKWLPLRLQDADSCDQASQLPVGDRSFQLPQRISKRMQEVRQAYDQTLDMAMVKVRPQSAVPFGKVSRSSSAPRLHLSRGHHDPGRARLRPTWSAQRSSNALQSCSTEALRQVSREKCEVDFTQLRGIWHVKVLQRGAVVREPQPADGKVDLPWVLGRALKALRNDSWRLLLESCHHCEMHRMSTWHDPEEYEGIKDIVDQTVRQLQKELKVELTTAHLPTPLLNQRLGACEVFLLPPLKVPEGPSAVAYLLHSKLISRTWPTVKSLLWKLHHSMPRIDEAWKSLQRRDKVQRSFSKFMLVDKAKKKFKAAGLLARVEVVLEPRRRSITCVEEVLAACREEEMDMNEARIVKALSLHNNLKRLLQELIEARENQQILRLRNALIEAEDLQFWNEEVAAADAVLRSLWTEAQAARLRRDVRRLHECLEGWMPHGWKSDDWTGDGDTWDLSVLRQAAERHVEWQALLASVRAAYKEVMSHDVPDTSHLEALRSAFKGFEVAKLRGIPEEEVDSWRQALQIFYERQVAKRRNSEPEVQQSKEDRVANELYKVLNATPLRLDELEAALQNAELEGAPLCKVGEEKEPWSLPRGLHRLAPLAAKHQRQLQKMRSLAEELLANPTPQLLDLPEEAEHYQVAGSRHGFADNSIEAARQLCLKRALLVRIDPEEGFLHLRMGPRSHRDDEVGRPVSVLITVRRNQTRPEEHFATDSNGFCFLPEGIEGIKVTLPDEPGLLPCMVKVKSLQGGWHQERLENDPEMLRALVLPGSGRCYLSLGGARNHFPSHGWQPVQLQLRLGHSRLGPVRCSNAGCTWTGHEGDLPSHQLQCEEIRRICRAVATQRRSGSAVMHLAVTLSWYSEGTRSDLDMSVEHPCGKTVSYHRTLCVQCGAQLDIDSQGAPGQQSLENISWSEAPPEGTYTVYVELFRGPKASFQILVQSEGNTMRLFSHSNQFFDAGRRKVAATFQVTSKGIVFNTGAIGLFRRAAYVSMLARRLTEKAKSSPSQEESSWDCSTDGDGWCRIGKQKSLCIAPPKVSGFQDRLPLTLDLACHELPQEVVFPQKVPSGRRSSRQW